MLDRDNFYLESIRVQRVSLLWPLLSCIAPCWFNFIHCARPQSRKFNWLGMSCRHKANMKCYTCKQMHLTTLELQKSFKINISSEFKKINYKFLGTGIWKI